MPLQKGVQNNVYGFNSFDYKISMFKINDMHMAGYILIRRNFLYDSALLVLGLLSCLLDTCALVKQYAKYFHA